MERRAEAYLTLVQELDLAWRHVDGQSAKNREMTARVEAGAEPNEHDWVALGYTIHNLYNALENYFLRIAKFFENSLESPTWHRDLVDRMTLSIEGVRPALLPASSRQAVHELRSFRHVFRSIYDSTLQPERVASVNALVPQVVDAMRSAHPGFVQKLRSIAREL